MSGGVCVSGTLVKLLSSLYDRTGSGFCVLAGLAGTAIRMLFRDKICAVVAAADARSALKQLGCALRFTRTVELRLDWLRDDRRDYAIFGRAGCADACAMHGWRRSTLIATCRRVVAGGKFRGSAANQLLYLAEALRAGCTWYDLDIETASIAPRGLLDVLVGEGRRLISAHFFRKAPANLGRVARALDAFRPDAIKVAARADSLAASVKVLELARGRSSRVVAVPMGEAALPARVLALRHGSALAYAPVEHDTAPGQVSLDAMVNLYRAGKLTRLTRGVRSDRRSDWPFALAASAQCGLSGAEDRCCVSAVPGARAEGFLGCCWTLGIRGFAITLPHKQAILRYLDSCDPMAAAIGAVNTVVGERGWETARVQHGLRRRVAGARKRIALRGSRVLIVGAGGAARAVAFALAQAGAAVCVTARRPAQAERWRGRRWDGGARADVRREFFDAIVNATPVGMHPQLNRIAAGSLGTEHPAGV